MRQVLSVRPQVEWSPAVPHLESVINARSPRGVTFDFFDTLVSRPAFRPELMHERVLAAFEESDIQLPDNWLSLRQTVEHELSSTSRYGETTISAVYGEIGKRLHWPGSVIHEVQATEIALEVGAWKPRVEVLQLINVLMRHNIQVAILSDTILPSSVIATYLAEHGLPGIGVHTSSELRATKRHGDAFNVLPKALNLKPGEILHVGDSFVSDGINAALAGIYGCVLLGPGHLASSTPADATDLAINAGLCGYPDYLLKEVSAGQSSVIASWAFSWAQVCGVYLSGLIDFAKQHRVDSVWLTSRDCESLEAAIRIAGRSRLPLETQYVHFSRQSIRPLQDAPESERGETLPYRYAESLLNEVTAVEGKRKRVLIADVGWSGTLQSELQKAFPDVEFFGFYLSLDPKAPPRVLASSRGLIPWNLGRFNRAMCELLFGFEGPSCVGYCAVGDEAPRPTFEPRSLEYISPYYLKVLRDLLASEISRGVRVAAVGDIELCGRLVNRLLMRPRYEELFGLEEWRIGTNVGSTNSSSVLGVEAHWATVVAGKFAPGNVWPAGALAWRLQHRAAVQITQVLSASIRAIRS